MFIRISRNIFRKILRFTQEHYSGRYTVYLSERTKSERFYIYSLDGKAFAARSVEETRPFPFFIKRKRKTYFLDADSPHIKHLTFLINPKKETLK